MRGSLQEGVPGQVTTDKRTRVRGLGQEALALDKRPLAKYCWQEAPHKKLLAGQHPQEGMG